LDSSSFTASGIQALGFNNATYNNQTFVAKNNGNQSIAGNVSIASPGSCMFWPNGAKVCGAVGDTCITVYSPNGLTKARVCN
jgi:hypothetical protein